MALRIRALLAFLAIVLLVEPLAIVLASLPAQAIPAQVTVKLFESLPTLQEIEVDSPLEMTWPTRMRFKDKVLVVRAQGARVAVFAYSVGERRAEHLIAKSTFFTFRGLLSKGAGIRVAPYMVHHYRGMITVSAAGNAMKGDRLIVKNQVSARDYVVSVVGSETQPGWPVEAMKAQAVLTQTRLARLKPNEQFGDSTQKEAYLGSNYERPGTRDAVESVWGKTLQFDKRPSACFYHSCCAGRTSNAVDVFGEAAAPLTYLKSVKCDYCKKSNFWKPTKSKIKWSSFKNAFGPAVPEIVQKDSAGRPKTLKLASKRTAGGAAKELSGYQFWIQLGQKFGWDKAPGTRFTLSKEGEYVQIESTGAGHGVGLCQWGAAGLANSGKTFEQILQYYYAGCKVTP